MTEENFQLENLIYNPGYPIENWALIVGNFVRKDFHFTFFEYFFYVMRLLQITL
jgi:hypothetical protein